MTSDHDLLAQSPTLRFDDRVVWITGASRGLGRTLAYAFAGAGASVLLTARSEEPLRETAADIEAAGGSARVVAGSVTDPEAIATAAGIVEETWGTLDVLINNAGISPSFKRSEQVEEDELRAILDTNLVGSFAHCRAALPLLEGAGGGSIVNVGSVHGLVAHERMIGYAASKGGLELITRTLAIEWASRGVRVNSLAPGYIDTDMTVALREHPRWSESLLARTPIGRFATTTEIAACALFLASPISSYVTGSTLYVDGGWTAQ